MSKLFNRACQVTVGPKNAKGLQIRGLRMSFKIDKSTDKQPNPATIQIYNLSKDSRAIVEDKKSAIILEAGYGSWKSPANSTSENFEGILRKIFVGDVAQVKTERQGPDIITTVEAGDGEAVFGSSRINASFAPGVKASQILDAIVAKFGLSRGQIVGFNGNDSFPNGLSIVGLTRDAMETLMKRQGLSWSIQDDQLQILPPGKGTVQEAILLNKGTGLIGTPFKTKIVNINLLTKKDGKEADLGTKMTTLLNGEIVPGRYVKLESDFVSGIFKVSRVTHEGDTHGKNWYSNIEAK